MRILAIHSDYIKFTPTKKALKNAEEVEKKESTMKDCLVIFTSVEKQDEKNVKGIIKQLITEIKKQLKQVKANKIVLYPYAHLSDELAKPGTAEEVLKKAEKELKKEYKVIRAPFGWYKKFEISCKGHPLAEASRQFGVSKKADEVSKALKAEDKLKSKWYILDLKGKLNPVSVEKGKVKGFDFNKYKNLRKLSLYEMAKNRMVDQEPAHVKSMRKLELADYEPGSDPGNLRYPPKGRLVKSLIEQWVTQAVIDYGGMEIESPIMYDYEHPILKKYLNRFPARQYVVESPNKRLFLRFAACFGQFLMSHDMTISYRDLPLRMYELTRYSFRAEKRGELTGLRRLRAFTMPDCHALCADFEQAKKEMMKRFELSKRVHNGIGLNVPEDFELALRVVKDIWDEHGDFIKDLVKSFGKPALLEMWDERPFYYVFKYEWNFVDTLNKAATLTTDQFDVENGETYDLSYTDKDGKDKRPIILHLSPSGAVERVMYALLEKEAWQQKEGKKPMLPLWLSPTQVRLCPINDSFIGEAEKLANELIKGRVRVDIDDRSESIGKKIRHAENEWIPYIIVIGDKEKGKSKLPVRDRAKGSVNEMTIKELIKIVEKDRAEKPFKKLSLPLKLSDRPSFIG